MHFDAEQATRSEIHHNSACIQSATNLRFRDRDGSRERKKEIKIKTIKRETTGIWKGKKIQRKQHLSSVAWKVTRSLLEVCSTDSLTHMGPCKKEKKNVSGDIAWQISHPWTTGMGLRWHKDGRGGQQTAWHINHLSPVGHKLYEETQVAERHMLAGSVTTERSPEISSSFCRMWDKKRSLHTNSQRAISKTRKTETAWQNSSIHPLSFKENTQRHM